MNKKINELTTDELKTVFKTNYKLQIDVLSDYEESEMDYIGEILGCFRDSLNDWNIGFNNYNSIKYENKKRLLENALQAQKDYCFLPDKYTTNIKKLLDKYITLYNIDYNNSKYEKLENYLVENVEKIATAIIEQFNNMTKSPKMNELESYFIEFYADARLSESCYIDAKTYIMYENIAYTKNYT